MQDEEGEVLRRRLGLSRRSFVRSAAAYGLGLWAIGQVMPNDFGQYLGGAGIGEAAPFTDAPATCASPTRSWPTCRVSSSSTSRPTTSTPEGIWRVDQPGLPRRVHGAVGAVRPARRVPAASTRTASGHGFGRGGELDPIQNLSRYHYMKELFLDSSTNMTVLSAVPSAPEHAAAADRSRPPQTVDMVNKLAKAQRGRSCTRSSCPTAGRGGDIVTGRCQPGRSMQDEFDIMERNVQSRSGDRMRGWKVYTPWGDVPNASGWFLDDEIGTGLPRPGAQAARPQRRRPSRSPATRASRCRPSTSAPRRPRDIGPAARQNPDINFIVYHSGFDSETQGPTRATTRSTRPTAA